MNQRITEKFVTKYDRIILTQPLAHNKYLKQVYDKCNKGWLLSYKSDSVYHICPFDGTFRNCADCGATNEDFNIEYCVNKTQLISTGALIERIVDCQKANLKVDFLYYDDIDLEE